MILIWILDGVLLSKYFTCYLFIIKTSYFHCLLCSEKWWKAELCRNFCANSLPFCLQKKVKNFQVICHWAPVANNACCHPTRFDHLINLPGSRGRLAKAQHFLPNSLPLSSTPQPRAEWVKQERPPHNPLGSESHQWGFCGIGLFSVLYSAFWKASVMTKILPPSSGAIWR